MATTTELVTEMVTASEPQLPPSSNEPKVTSSEISATSTFKSPALPLPTASDSFRLVKKEVHFSKATCMTVSEKFVFVGGLGICGSIAIWEIVDRDLVHAGNLMYMLGCPTRLSLNRSATKLIACTMPGYVYVWDVSPQKIAALKWQTDGYDSLQNDFIPDKQRFQPLACFTPENYRQCIAVAFLQDDTTLIGIGKIPQQGIVLYSSENACRIGRLPDLFTSIKDNNATKSSVHIRRNVYEFNCVCVDAQRYTLSKAGENGINGNWTAVSDSSGHCGVLFISDEILRDATSQCGNGLLHNNENPSEEGILKIRVPSSTTKLCHSGVEITSLVWSPRGAQERVTLLCGCSDGFVRYALLGVGKNGLLTLTLTFIQRLVRGDCLGEVRQLCVTKFKEGSNYIYAACNSSKKSETCIRLEKSINEDIVIEDSCTDGIYELRGRRIKGAEWSPVSFQHREPLLDLSLSPEGRFLASLSLDRTMFMYFWDGVSMTA
ncbi:hypothetical protein IE077_003402 [Cardiosporidium cionae]|uniref:Uncharacterized protein n=1 Tax=Cardiosporidium cionae TaxID=476202 RepID=A0ABQ7J8B4_9APIC|nr:hypothetical protein IE077_003402 [Cardiosporidium cionae]|eukprot:KAF8820237.1 hypothetical protein IE077_003402 [Cardiosporidium cionae]